MRSAVVRPQRPNGLSMTALFRQLWLICVANSEGSPAGLWVAGGNLNGAVRWASPATLRSKPRFSPYGANRPPVGKGPSFA
jgi:hypothetical protein